MVIKRRVLEVSLVALLIGLGSQLACAEEPESRSFHFEQPALVPRKHDPKNLNASTRCQVDLLKKSATPLDRCMADCLEKGQGRNVSGGCAHVCGKKGKGFDISAWQPPEGMQDCMKLRGM